LRTATSNNFEFIIWIIWKIFVRLPNPSEKLKQNMMRGVKVRKLAKRGRWRTGPLQARLSKLEPITTKIPQQLLQVQLPTISLHMVSSPDTRPSNIRSLRHQHLRGLLLVLPTHRGTNNHIISNLEIIRPILATEIYLFSRD